VGKLKVSTLLTLDGPSTPSSTRLARLRYSSSTMELIPARFALGQTALEILQAHLADRVYLVGDREDIRPRTNGDSAGELERFGMGDHLARRRRFEQGRDHRLGKRVTRLPVAGDRELEIVLSPPQADLGPEERPERTGLTLVGHADAAGVHGTHYTIHDAVELDVRMGADKNLFGYTCHQLTHAPRRRAGSDQFLVAPRRPVAKPDSPEAVDVDNHAFREVLERVKRRDRMVSEHPALTRARSRLGRPPQLAECAFRVSPHEQGTPGERLVELTNDCPGFFGQGPPGQVAEEDEQIGLCGDELFGDGGKSDRIAVDVGCDGGPARSMTRHARRLAGSPACDQFFVLRRKDAARQPICSGR
jgi:hypothetical protein